MTDDRLNNISKAMAMTLITLICLLVFLAKAFGQDTGNHTHTGADLARFRLVRILPAKVLYIEPNEHGKRVEYEARDSKEIEVNFFQKTKEVLGDEPKKGEYFWFAYCGEDWHLYSIYAVTNEQRKALK